MDTATTALRLFPYLRVVPGLSSFLGPLLGCGPQRRWRWKRERAAGKELGRGLRKGNGMAGERFQQLPIHRYQRDAKGHGQCDKFIVVGRTVAAVDEFKHPGRVDFVLIHVNSPDQGRRTEG
jgi:hypothetical protein